MPIKENEFTTQVLQYAKLRGWRTAHFRPGMNRRGQWSTAVQGDGVGFPDLVLIRGDRFIVAELKCGKNKTTPEQDLWISAFKVAGIDAFVWRPNDWGFIENTLA